MASRLVRSARTHRERAVDDGPFEARPLPWDLTASTERGRAIHARIEARLLGRDGEGR